MATYPGARGGRRLTVLATGLVTTVWVAGCGGSAADPSGAGATTLPGIKEFGLTEEQFADHVERAQQAIADCMAEAGFEYIPVDVRTVEAAQARVRQDPGFTRRTYKEKWGLGVTTRVDNPVRDIGLGPNLDIWNGLPEADREAYARARWGEDPNADFVFTLDEEDFSRTGGCTREGVAKVFTPEQLRGTYVNPKDVLVDSDLRIIEARANWAECMAERGYDYEEDQDEIIEEYTERLDQLLQQEEIAVSLADLECQIEYTDEIYRKVEFEVFGQQVSG